MSLTLCNWEVDLLILLLTLYLFPAYVRTGGAQDHGTGWARGGCSQEEDVCTANQQGVCATRQRHL